MCTAQSGLTLRLLCEHVDLLIELFVSDFLVSNISSDHLFIPTNCRNKVAPCPEFSSGKVLRPPVKLLCNPYRTLALYKPNHLGNRVFRRNGQQHMYMIRHHVTRFNLALLTRCKFMKYRPQLLAQLTKQYFLAIFRDEYDMVLTLPCRVI